MILKKLKEILDSVGFEHHEWLSKPNWKGNRRLEHFFIKGDCRIKYDNGILEIQFLQSLKYVNQEKNLIGPFRDGVMFDLNSREMIR